MPWVSTLLKPARKLLHSMPTAPMVKAEAARHGALGASGCSSGRIEKYGELSKHGHSRMEKTSPLP